MITDHRIQVHYKRYNITIVWNWSLYTRTKTVYLNKLRGRDSDY